MSYGNDKKPVYTKLKKHYCIIHLAKTFASKQMKSVEDSNLLGSWTDSLEENQLNSNGRVFRTFDFKKFPPSRFRFKMELNEDGSCKYLHPTDRHGMISGKWDYDAKTQTLKILDVDGKIIKSHKVLKRIKTHCYCTMQNSCLLVNVKKLQRFFHVTNASI